MPTCYVLPGFVSSDLFYVLPERLKLWISYHRLALDGPGGMRLDPSGQFPQPPDGATLEPGGPLFGYWDAPIAQLQDQLRPHGYSVRGLGYDWRMNPIGTANGLLQVILAEVTAEDPCTIVAHSMGGLLTRLCWAMLVTLNKQHLVRRIVTLGTPHQGTYAPIACFSKHFYVIDNLIQFQKYWTGWTNYGGLAPLVRQWTAAELRDLTCTWPALYMLFPVLGSPTSLEDPNRAILFDKSRWPSDVAISARHLDYSQRIMSPLLLQPRTFPPAWVMTTVAGDNYGTDDRLDYPDRLGDPIAIGTTHAGDEIVTKASALIADSAQVVLTAKHHDLPSAALQQGLLASLVLDSRTEPAPPPPLEQSSINYPPFQPGPPLLGALGPSPTGTGPGEFAADPCGGQPCRC